MRGTLQRGHLGQALQAVLGGDIRRFERGRPQPVHGREVDHPPPAARVHERERVLQNPERRRHHRPQDPGEGGGREFLDRSHHLQPGVVDHDVWCQFLLELAGAVTDASALFLVSAGLTLAFGALRIINMAHGSFYMYGAAVLLTLAFSQLCCTVAENASLTLSANGVFGAMDLGVGSAQR